jgi:hypothetical protein
MTRTATSDAVRRVAITWLATVVVCLPILALLLTPQLMRSRAGSGPLLGFGTALLLVLVAGAVVIAPVISARVAPVTPDWTPRTAIRTTARTWRRQRWGSITTLAGFLAIYVVAQLAGLGIAELLPYVSDNPAFVEGGTESRWVIHYPQYLVQALVIYAIVALALAWYGDRLRGLAAAQGRACTDEP